MPGVDKTGQKKLFNIALSVHNKIVPTLTAMQF